MARILVAGAGCGGLVAAIKLAEMGHNVTVFEKSDKDLLGLEQTDAIDLSAFEMAGIPVDPDFTVGKNTLTIFPPDKSVASITLPPPSEDSVLADRRHLAKHFTDLCEKSRHRSGTGISGNPRRSGWFHCYGCKSTDDAGKKLQTGLPY